MPTASKCCDKGQTAGTCTHNGKELDYLHGEGSLACCGRSSRFDLTRAVIHGPDEAPMLRYQAWHKADDLVIEV